jgi:hypothetical protein
MKTLLGVLLILGGIALGTYLGLWVCFIGGIIQIVNAIKAPGAIHAGIIAGGVVKIVFAGFIGQLSAALLIVPGAAMLND